MNITATNTVTGITSGGQSPRSEVVSTAERIQNRPSDPQIQRPCNSPGEIYRCVQEASSGSASNIAGVDVRV